MGAKEFKLSDIDQVELSLTVAPAIQEEFLMTKTQVQKALPEDDEDEEDKGKETPSNPAAKTPPEDDEDKKKPTFNFDKADEQTKGVLAAVGQALLNLAGQNPEAVSPEVATFAKSAAALAPTKKADDTLIAFAKSAFPGLVEAIQAPLSQEVSGLQTRLGKMEEEKELEEMRKVAADLPGDPEKVAHQLIKIKKALTEDEFKAHIETQRGLKEQVTKSELFQRTSSNQPLTGSAEERIMSKASAMVAKSEGGVTDLAGAIDAIAKSDPGLWNEYQEEVRNRVVRRPSGN